MKQPISTAFFYCVLSKVHNVFGKIWYFPIFVFDEALWAVFFLMIITTSRVSGLCIYESYNHSIFLGVTDIPWREVGVWFLKSIYWLWFLRRRDPRLWGRSNMLCCDSAICHPPGTSLHAMRHESFGRRCYAWFGSWSEESQCIIAKTVNAFSDESLFELASVRCCSMYMWRRCIYYGPCVAVETKPTLCRACSTHFVFCIANTSCLSGCHWWPCDKFLSVCQNLLRAFDGLFVPGVYMRSYTSMSWSPKFSPLPRVS